MCSTKLVILPEAADFDEALLQFFDASLTYRAMNIQQSIHKIMTTEIIAIYNVYDLLLGSSGLFARIASEEGCGGVSLV